MLALLLFACEGSLLYLPYAPEWSQASSGRIDACALRSDGYLACQDADVTEATIVTAGFELRREDDGWAEIEAGWDVVCAVDDEGLPDCWGDPESPVLTESAPEDLNPGWIGLGEDHACALDEGGAAVCWGEGAAGQLDVPAGVYTALAVGADHACAIDEAGALICWGGAGGAYATAGLEGVLAVDAGDGITCALLEDGGITCLVAEGEEAPTLQGGPWSGLAVGELGLCAWDEDGGLGCALDPPYAETPLPEVRIESLSLSDARDFGCGVTMQGRLVCLGEAAPDLEGWD